LRIADIPTIPFLLEPPPGRESDSRNCPSGCSRAAADTLGYRHEEEKLESAAAILTEVGTGGGYACMRAHAALSITYVIFAF